MARICISIENDSVLTRFDQALTRAGAVACDMILVKTKIEQGCLLKVVRTKCQSAISEFQTLEVFND